MVIETCQLQAQAYAILEPGRLHRVSPQFDAENSEGSKGKAEDKRTSHVSHLICVLMAAAGDPARLETTYKHIQLRNKNIRIT